MVSETQANTSGCEKLFVPMEGTLQDPSLLVRVVFIFLTIVNLLAFPFTVLLNILVLIAVKRMSRLRANKPNILLALLAFTDLIVGVIVLPTFISLLILTFPLGKDTNGSYMLSAVRLAMSCLCDASFIHLVLISAERLLSTNHPFSYRTMITESRLLVASACAWLLSLILHTPIISHSCTLFFHINNTFIGLCFVMIVLGHVTVYLVTRRHKKQIADQRVALQTRKQFLENQRVFMLTSLIVAAPLFCYIPTVVGRAYVLQYKDKVSVEAKYLLFFTLTTVMLLNSLVNPLIYSVRMRQFRIAFIQIMRAANSAEAEEIEMRLFGAPKRLRSIRIEE